MSQLIQRILNNLAFRMVIAATIVSVPLGLSVVWLGASYASILNGRSFLQNALEVVFPGGILVVAVGVGLAYPVERWVIRDRAMQSPVWLGIRLVAYLISGMIGGAVMRYTTALTGHDTPGMVSYSFYITSISIALVAGLVHALFERMGLEMKQREEALKKQLMELSIEIDQIKRDAEVQEVVNSEAFRALHEKARAIREGREVKSGERVK